MRASAKASVKKAATPARQPAGAPLPPDDGGFLRTIAEMEQNHDFVTALARGLAVLNSFSDRKRHMSISDVSHRTGIPRATVRRSLFTLAKLGFVHEDESRRYVLRPKVLTFGHAYLSGTPIALLAQPVLDRLSDKINQSCSLAVPEGDEIIYVARSTSSRIMNPVFNVGRRLPAYCTSIGYVVWGHRPEAELEAYLARGRFIAFTPNTVTSREELRKLFRAARQAGYATSDQQMQPHFRTLAVPVRNTVGTVVAGMNVIIPYGRLSIEQMIAQFAEPLRIAAAELSTTLLP